jgi:hypothetical protein
MYSTQLKIKRLSLGLEARLIRQEERRMKAKRKTEELDSLHFHRKGVVRPAARVANLAHAYLMGRPYSTVEDPNRTKSRPCIDWMNHPSICANLRTFGGAQFSQMDKKELFRAVSDWIDGGAPVGVGASNPRVAGSTPAVVAIP